MKQVKLIFIHLELSFTLSTGFNEYPYDLDKIDSHNYSLIYKTIQEKDLFLLEDTNHFEMFKNLVRKCLEKDIKKDIIFIKLLIIHG